MSSDSTSRLRRYMTRSSSSQNGNFVIVAGRKYVTLEKFKAKDYGFTSQAVNDVIVFVSGLVVGVASAALYFLL